MFHHNNIAAVKRIVKTQRFDPGTALTQGFFFLHSIGSDVASGW